MTGVPVPGGITLREPIATFIHQLNTFQFTVVGGRIEVNNGFALSRFPVLDHDDAVALAHAMTSAVTPILRKFADQKLAEFLPVQPCHVVNLETP